MIEPARCRGLSRREALASLSVILLVLAAVAIPTCSRAPAPVDHAFDSREALAQAVLDGLARRDRTRLRDIALSEREFARLVWPGLPASRPERNLPLDYVWGDLKQKSNRALTAALQHVNGRRLRLVRLEFTGGSTRYDTFVVHRDSRLVVDDGGAEQELRLFGSVYEDREGRFKVFSYVVD